MLVLKRIVKCDFFPTYSQNYIQFVLFELKKLPSSAILKSFAPETKFKKNNRIGLHIREDLHVFEYMWTPLGLVSLVEYGLKRTPMQKGSVKNDNNCRDNKNGTNQVFFKVYHYHLRYSVFTVKYFIKVYNKQNT